MARAVGQHRAAAPPPARARGRPARRPPRRRPGRPRPGPGPAAPPASAASGRSDAVRCRCSSVLDGLGEPPGRAVGRRRPASAAPAAASTAATSSATARTWVRPVDPGLPLRLGDQPLRLRPGGRPAARRGPPAAAPATRRPQRRGVGPGRIGRPGRRYRPDLGIARKVARSTRPARRPPRPARRPPVAGPAPARSPRPAGARGRRRPAGPRPAPRPAPAAAGARRRRRRPRPGNASTAARPGSSSSATCTSSSSSTARSRPGGSSRARDRQAPARARICSSAAAGRQLRAGPAGSAGRARSVSRPNSSSRARSCRRRSGPMAGAAPDAVAGAGVVDTRCRRSRVVTSSRVSPASAPTSCRPSTLSARHRAVPVHQPADRRVEQRIAAGVALLALGPHPGRRGPPPPGVEQLGAARGVRGHQLGDQHPVLGVVALPLPERPRPPRPARRPRRRPGRRPARRS